MLSDSTRRDFINVAAARIRLKQIPRGAAGCGVFDSPGFAAIEAAREQVFLGSLAVNVMALRAEVFVIAAAEADQDFVAPRPKPVVGRPTAEAPWLSIDLHVPEPGSARWFDVEVGIGLRVLLLPELLGRFGRQRSRRRGQQTGAQGREKPGPDTGKVRFHTRSLCHERAVGKSAIRTGVIFHLRPLIPAMSQTSQRKGCKLLDLRWRGGSQCSPIEDFQLHGAAAVVVVDLRGEGEVEAGRERGFIPGAPPDGLVSGGAVGDPQFEVLLLRAHALRRALLGQVAGEELDGRIPLAGRPQLVQGGQTFQGDVVQADLGIEAQGRLQVVGLEGAAGELVEAGAEGVQVGGCQAQARGHRVAALAEQQVAALAQRGGQVETGECCGLSRGIGRRRRRG